VSDINAVTYTGAVPVTTSDAAAQFQGSGAAGFIVGSAGTVKLRTLQKQDVTFTFGLAGQGLSLAFDWIYASGTSCTGIIALLAPQYKGDH